MKTEVYKMYNLESLIHLIEGDLGSSRLDDTTGPGATAG